MSSKGCSLSVDGDNSVCDPHDYTTHVHVLMDVEKYELGGLEKLQGSAIELVAVFSPLRYFCRKCRGRYKLKNKNSYLSQTDSVGFDPSTDYRDILQLVIIRQYFV